MYSALWGGNVDTNGHFDTVKQHLNNRNGSINASSSESKLVLTGFSFFERSNRGGRDTLNFNVHKCASRSLMSTQSL